MILCSFLWRIRWTTLENHRTKQMMVYEQITFFIKSIYFYSLFLGSCDPAKIAPVEFLITQLYISQTTLSLTFGQTNLAKYKKGTV